MSHKNTHIINHLEHIYFRGLEKEGAFDAESEKSIFALLCLSSLCPNVFDDNKVDHLRAIRYKWDIDPRYSLNWFRFVPLDCLLYGLTGNPYYLNIPIANMSHQSSSLRSLVFESLYYVAPKIEFPNETIFAKTEENIRIGHFFLERNLYILHLMRGNSESKINQLKKWSDSLVGKYDWQENIFNEFINEKYPDNPFSYSLIEIRDYLIRSLVNCCYPDAIQEKLEFDK